MSEHVSRLLMPYTLGTSVKDQSSLTITPDNYNNIIIDILTNQIIMDYIDKQNVHCMHMTVSAI